jgi:ubiquinone/menaquinone biosynthesis C-methylase UbiE
MSFRHALPALDPAAATSRRCRPCHVLVADQLEEMELVLQADLQRLLNIAELSAEPTRAAFSKIGMKPGWRVIDCGCGPLGALAVMAEMVGPEGQVVGIDFSEPAVQRARSIVSTLGLDNVEVRVGDVHDVDGQPLGSAFDLAYTRLFLMHQRPGTNAAADRRVASSGWVDRCSRAAS